LGKKDDLKRENSRLNNMFILINYGKLTFENIPLDNRMIAGLT